MKASNFLTPADLRSSEWGRLQKHIDERLLELRVDLERFDSDPTQTAVTRGRIAELKALATLPQASQDSPEARNRRRIVALTGD